LSLKAPITLNINGRDHAIEVEARRTLSMQSRGFGDRHAYRLRAWGRGACTVIVNGRAVRSSVFLCRRLRGQHQAGIDGV